MQRELAHRENDGITVTLHWHSRTGRLGVTVRDRRSDDSFELEAEPRNALDVFEHPYAYAANGGRSVAVAA